MQPHQHFHNITWNKTPEGNCELLYISGLDAKPIITIKHQNSIFVIDGWHKVFTTLMSAQKAAVAFVVQHYSGATYKRLKPGVGEWINVPIEMSDVPTIIQRYKFMVNESCCRGYVDVEEIGNQITLSYFILYDSVILWLNVVTADDCGKTLKQAKRQVEKWLR